ncbi:septation protein SepH [Kineococcus sp. SYSU DK003]|uniref:septation protein SepH n=1 Tax=Kineococcus sp. SYSU DK003 TaxID=3383124 RepID=UPI003D7DAFD7
MQDLRLVGVHDDGEHVVLVATDGSRYRLRVDEALRAAVRRDRARLGQLQIQMAAQLRPRDIQARIRAGESAEEVAEAGGLSLDHVRRYEGPVLAERAHVAGLARRTPYGRSGAAGSLDDVVVARLTARAVDPEGARWDAWRTEDGSWTVQCEFVAGGRGRVARWDFDPAARALSAQDDEARWLSEEEPADAGPLPARRLVSVGGEVGRPASERVYDVEADGGVRTNHTDDLLDALDSARGMRPGQAAAPVESSANAAPRVDALTTDPPPAHPAASAPGDLEDRTVLPGPVERNTDPEAGPGAGPETVVEGVVVEEPVAEEITGEPEEPAAEAVVVEEVVLERAVVVETTTEVVVADVTDEPGAGVPPPAEGTPAEQPNPRRRNRSARRNSASSKRPSVPSWDDIMFGTKKD